MTSNLYERATQHRTGALEGFTRKHGCTMLVWYEPHVLVTEALRREKALKRWNRPWKMQLIERENPEWADLYPFLCEGASDPRVKPEDDGSVESFLRRLDRGEVND